MCESRENISSKSQIEIEQDLSLMKGQSTEVIGIYIEGLGKDKGLGLGVLKTINPELYEYFTRPGKSQTSFRK